MPPAATAAAAATSAAACSAAACSIAAWEGAGAALLSGGGGDGAAAAFIVGNGSGSRRVAWTLKYSVSRWRRQWSFASEIKVATPSKACSEQTQFTRCVR